MWLSNRQLKATQTSLAVESRHAWQNAAYWMVCLLLAVAARAQTVKQDGPHWVRSAHMEAAQLAANVRNLEIFGQGRIVVRGGDSREIQIKVTQRVRAASEEEANRFWGPHPGNVGYAANVNTVRLRINSVESPRVSTELEIGVPRQLASVWINNTVGDVEVYDLNGNVRADTGGGRLVLDRIQGSVRTYSRLGDIQLGTIGGAIFCSTGGGAIVISSGQQDADCSTGGGDIAVASIGGPLRVTTEGGNIHVEKAGAEVWAKSLAGQVEVVSAKGTVFADSAAGGVRVRGGSGPMNVSAMMGSIIAELLGGRFADSSLTAGSGDITVWIPDGLGLAVRVQNAAGATPRVVSDFPNVQLKSIDFRSPGSGWWGQAAINGGGPILDLNTNGGVIYLRRVKR